MESKGVDTTTINGFDTTVGQLKQNLETVKTMNTFMSDVEFNMWFDTFEKSYKQFKDIFKDYL